MKPQQLDRIPRHILRCVSCGHLHDRIEAGCRRCGTHSCTVHRIDGIWLASDPQAIATEYLGGQEQLPGMARP